jgi:hypothetical protein
MKIWPHNCAQPFASSPERRRWMTFPIFHGKDPGCRRALRDFPRDRPPHLMRDIGLNPSPDRKHLTFHPLW